ncbi:MAG: hypothetical protein ABIO83_09970 [Ilumatobacteraceae bacterium]
MHLDPDLEADAEVVRADLGLDSLLGLIGESHVVGSAALGLMVWPDIDITVVCDELVPVELYRAAESLVAHPRVRQITIRNDAGPWNNDPDTYPDGIYWGIDYRNERRNWNLDIWFVTDAERQPDLRHLRELGPRITDETRTAILEIKHAWFGRPEYGTTVTSFGIYTAVLDDGVRSPAEFDQHLRRRTAP